MTLKEDTEHEEHLRAIVGSFHPGEEFLLTLRVCAGTTDLEALGSLVDSGDLLSIEFPKKKRRRRKGRWSDQDARERRIKISAAFRWQEFWLKMSASKIETIVQVT